jgi:CRP-like cAMP-binding protein
VARRRTFARHEVVFHRGDPADSLHLIRKGRFAVQVTTPLADVVTLAILTPGQAFGELSLLSEGGVRSATVVALERGETLSVFRDDFRLLLANDPSVNAVLARLLAERVQRLDDLLVEAHTLPADKRVLRRLHELTSLYPTAAGPTVIPLTQQDLAGLAGTSRATVNRVLREQEQQGVVVLSRSRMTIVDLEVLSQRAWSVPVDEAPRPRAPAERRKAH